MSHLSLRLAMAAGCLALITACESPRRRRPRRPKPTPSHTGSVSAAGGGSQAVRLPAGHVAFTFKGADLANEVLPTFQRQAGVVIKWSGESRLLTLRLSEPMPWSDALDLVCQFTKTHATKDWQDRLILKDGWHGRPTSETLGDLTGEGSEGSGSVTSRRGQSNRTGSGNSTGGQPAGSTSNARPDPTPFGSAYSGGDKARDILRGTNTTQAGGH